MYAQALLLALAGSALATPTVVLERDLPTVTNALNSVNSASTALDTAVNSFSGAGDVAGLQSAAAALLSAIGDANSKIAASSQLSLTDAIALQSASGGLTTGAQTLVNDIIAKKSAFDAVCASGAVLDQLNKQKDASGQLANTIVSKLPDALQSIGASQSSGVTDAVQKGINAYQGSPSSCASTGSGSTGSSGSSGSSGASAPASAPSSAAAAGGSTPASSAPAAAASSGSASSGGASSGSAASSKPASAPSATASSTPSKSTPTPSPSVTPFTGGAAPKGVAAGFFSVAAIAAVFAIAL